MLQKINTNLELNRGFKHIKNPSFLNANDRKKQIAGKPHFVKIVLASFGNFVFLHIYLKTYINKQRDLKIFLR